MVKETNYHRITPRPPLRPFFSLRVSSLVMMLMKWFCHWREEKTRHTNATEHNMYCSRQRTYRTLNAWHGKSWSRNSSAHTRPHTHTHTKHAQKQSTFVRHRCSGKPTATTARKANIGSTDCRLPIFERSETSMWSKSKWNNKSLRHILRCGVWHFWKILCVFLVWRRWFYTNKSLNAKWLLKCWLRFSQYDAMWTRTAHKILSNSVGKCCVACELS